MSKVLLAGLAVWCSVTACGVPPAPVATLRVLQVTSGDGNDGIYGPPLSGFGLGGLAAPCYPVRSSYLVGCGPTPFTFGPSFADPISGYLSPWFGRIW